MAARLPSALAGVECIWLTISFGTALTRRPRVGIISGAVLFTVFRFAHLARRAQLDIVLTFFVLLALYALFQQRHCEAVERTQAGRGGWFYALHMALGLALLTKGPVALLPIPAFALYLAWQGRLRHFRHVFPTRSFAISLLPALVGLGLATALAPAGYFEQAVVQNLFARFFSGTAHVRPFYYFVVQFPLEFLPWSLLWPWVAIQTWRRCQRDSASTAQDGTRWLMVWVGLCTIFFSISAGSEVSICCRSTPLSRSSADLRSMNFSSGEVGCPEPSGRRWPDSPLRHWGSVRSSGSTKGSTCPPTRASGCPPRSDRCSFRSRQPAWLRTRSPECGGGSTRADGRGARGNIPAGSAGFCGRLSRL